MSREVVIVVREGGEVSVGGRGRARGDILIA